VSVKYGVFFFIIIPVRIKHFILIIRNKKPKFGWLFITSVGKVNDKKEGLINGHGHVDNIMLSTSIMIRQVIIK
jgi:hypothetical protein